MSLLLKSEHIFDTKTKTTFAGFLLIEDQKITAVGPLSALPTLAKDTQVIDLKEQMIIPGFIDAHVHFYLSALLHQGH